MFDCLAGTVRPDGGRVPLGGRDVTGLPAHRRVRLGLGRTFQQIAAEPAGGQPTGVLRLVEPARALAGEPRVLLLDEPAAGLDAAQTARLVSVLRGLTERGMALQLVEHDAELVAELADAVYAMVQGRVVAAGPAAAVLTDPRVTRARGAAT
ncbi:hypothetical protein GCM10010519_39760 [Streptomyces lactacystinicus]